MPSRRSNLAAPVDMPALAGPRQWAGLAVLALPTILLAMDATVLYLAVPNLAADLGPSSTQVLWITDIYGFMIAGFLVLMGTIGDRIGRRRLLMLGSVAFAAASVGAAYASSTEMLILARGVLGVAGATLMPSTLALISTMFRDPRQRGVAVGIWAACLSSGVALGPAVGGVLLEWFWWGAVFLIAVPVMGLLLATAPVLLPEHRPGEFGRIDLPSVVMSLVGILLLVYGIKQLAAGEPVVVSVVSTMTGLAIGAVFVRRQRRLSEPLVDLRLFRHRAFAVALTTLLVGLAAVAGTYLFVTVYLQEVLGLAPLAAGLWLVPSAVAMIITSVVAPILTRRVPARYVVGAGLAVSAAGFFMLTWLEPASGLPLLVTGFVVIYAGQGPMMALSTDLVVGSVPPERAGTASALSETSVELGLAFGVATLGSAGAAVYRKTMAEGLSSQVPPPVAEQAAESFANARTVAAELPAGPAAELLGTAREAFAAGLDVVAGVAGGLTLLLAVIALFALRERGAARE